MDLAICALISVTCFLVLFLRLFYLYNRITLAVTDCHLNQLKKRAARVENCLAVVGGIALVFLIFTQP